MFWSLLTYVVLDMRELKMDLQSSLPNQMVTLPRSRTKATVVPRQQSGFERELCFRRYLSSNRHTMHTLQTHIYSTFLALGVETGFTTLIERIRSATGLFGEALDITHDERFWDCP